MTNKHIYKKEELLNTGSHLIGGVFGVLGFFLLLNRNSEETKYATLSIIIYSLSFISMFIASSAYHYVTKPELKRKLRVVDHINIYFLIAGTYTPVTLILLLEGNGLFIFCAVWSIAFIGTILKLFFTGKYEVVSLLLYLVMGWLIVFDIKNLLDVVSTLEARLLLLGGILYTLGVFFYVKDKKPLYHFIWHLFVLGGAFSHWLFIYSFVGVENN